MKVLQSILSLFMLLFSNMGYVWAENVAAYTVVGEINMGGDYTTPKLITHYPAFQLICLESGYENVVYTKRQAAFQCWDIETAPTKLKELVD